MLHRLSHHLDAPLVDQNEVMYDVSPVASAAAELGWTTSHEMPPQTVHAQLELPHHSLCFLRAQLLVAITMRD